MKFLKGKKTYLIAVIAAVALFGQLAGLWEVPAELWQGLGIGGLATLRAGVKK